MIKRNIDGVTGEPFLLKPVGKDYLWGGQRLNDDYSKGIYLNPLAETWECSTHPDGISTVVSGAFSGSKLTDVIEEHPELVGTHPRKLIRKDLPVLIKMIDANENLSVQVHPSDEYACTNEDGELGKDEMWYVLDAEKNAKLVYGFNRDVSREQVTESIANGEICKLLNYVPVHKDDIFFIKAGTVHAIGAGVLLAEIQESSNLTYRLYDYDRKDSNGKKRALHVDKALDVADLKRAVTPRQPIRKLSYRPGYASELLCRCKYFEVERILIHTERVRKMAEIKTGHDSFCVLLCINGCGDLFGRNTLIIFFKGDCIFIPADSEELKIHGECEFLKIRC